MKQHFLFAAAVAALMTCACSVESVDPIQPETEGEFVVLTAGFSADEDGTRTVRQEDGKVFWGAQDEIAVIRASRTSSGSSRFVSTNTAPAPVASFQGELPSGSGSSFWALHPYMSGANYDGTYLVTSLPDQQEAVPGTFADDLFISAAYFNASAESLSFYHVVGGIKFSVTEPGVERITLTASGGESLTGVIGIKLVSGRPTITAYGSTQSQVVLTPESGTFEVGKPYYFVLIPTTLEKGFSLLFEKEDGSVATRSTDKSVTFEAAHFKTMMEVDKGLSYGQFFHFSPEEISLSKEGGLFNIQVNATMNFHFDVASDWIWEVSHTGNPLLGATYTFKASQNDGEARDGYILLCNDAGLGTGNCYIITVHQEAGSAEDWKTAQFAHHSLGMRFTATWCGYCPTMSETFRLAKEKLGDRFQYACFYATDGNYGFSGTNTLANQYGVTSFPTGIVDGRSLIQNYNNTEYGSNVIVQAVEETESNYPTATGIGVASSLDGETVSVDVNVFTHLADSYKLTVLLLENGIIGYQSGYGDGFVHNKVVRKALTTVSGNAFTVTEAVSKQSFTFSTTVGSDYDPDNLEILVYVQRPFGSQSVIQSGNYGDWYVDNCVSVPVGKVAAADLK